MAGTAKSVYNQLLQVTHRYLGTAADELIDSQLENHLHKAPQDLSAKDLLSLIDWIRVMVSLITEDNELIESYIHSLQRLAKTDANSKVSH